MSEQSNVQLEAAGLNRVDLDALVDARHHDPFSQLGMHDTSAGPVVRVMLPNAGRVSVIARDNGRLLGELEQLHPGGLFAGPVSEAVPYRLRIDWQLGRRALVLLASFPRLAGWSDPASAARRFDQCATLAHLVPVGLVELPRRAGPDSASPDGGLDPRVAAELLDVLGRQRSTSATACAVNSSA